MTSTTVDIHVVAVERFPACSSRSASVSASKTALVRTSDHCQPAGSGPCRRMRPRKRGQTVFAMFHIPRLPLSQQHDERRQDHQRDADAGKPCSYPCLIHGQIADEPAGLAVHRKRKSAFQRRSIQTGAGGNSVRGRDRPSKFDAGVAACTQRCRSSSGSERGESFIRLVCQKPGRCRVA